MAKAAKKAATAETKTPKKAATAAPKKAAAKTAKATPKDEGGKSPNAGLMAPLTVTPDLAKVVGKEPLPRTQIIKKIWDYIKAHDLQDKNNRRMINADATLKVIFGGKDQVSMFELAKVVNNHVKK